MKQKVSYKTGDVIYLLIGTLLLAIATKLLFEPAGFVIGGVSGLAIIVKALTERIIPGGFPMWATNLILNIPLFIIAIRRAGWRFVQKTAIATGLFSLWLAIIPDVVIFPIDDHFLTSAFGGTLSGLGIGLVLLAQATTGGTDMAAVLIHQHIRHHSIARIMQALDAFIVVGGAFVFGIPLTMYAIVAIYLMGKVSDWAAEGGKASKAAYIISDCSNQIADIIMKELDRGVTGIPGVGMYSHASRSVLLCVVSNKEIVAVKEITKRVDVNAFIVVCDVREVLGEGFVEYKQ